MTAIVSSPRRTRARVNFMASDGLRMRISSPVVSCCGRQALTLVMIDASCARSASSQNTAGAPEALARGHCQLPPSPRIGSSRV